MNDLTFFTKSSGTLEKGSNGQKAIAAIGQAYGVKATKNMFGNGQNTLVLAFDATGSMSGIWRAAREGINKLLTRLQQLYPDVAIALIAYRDYSDGQKIIEKTGSTTNPQEIKSFLQGIECDGGDDEPEAVEVALEKILQMNPGAAIIVGDAPPHGIMDELVKKDFRQICAMLAQANVPVHAVSTNRDNNTLRAFEEISRLTKGLHVPLEKIESLIDVLSFATAESLGSVAEFIALVKQEQNGRLTAAQEKIFRLTH